MVVKKDKDCVHGENVEDDPAIDGVAKEEQLIVSKEDELRGNMGNEGGRLLSFVVGFGSA